jgi:hypothetical protein
MPVKAIDQLLFVLREDRISGSTVGADAAEPVVSLSDAVGDDVRSVSPER